MFRQFKCGAEGWRGWTALVALLASVPLTAPASPQTIYRKVLPSVMTLEVENRAGERFVGSAVLTLADDTALTAWHVVSDARSVCAIFEDGTRVKVSGWVARDPERDVALLRLDKPMPGRRAVFSREIEPVASRAYVIGAPKGYGFSITDGLISQIRQVGGFSQYQISCPISAGNSGGPVLNEKGLVIGIVLWTKTDAQNVSFAITSREADGLKAGPAVSFWEQPVPAPPSAAGPTTTNSAVVFRADPSEISSDELTRFTQRLAQSVGKKVSVVVQEDGQETKFRFTVPRAWP